jgi:hypothetical protein
LGRPVLSDTKNNKEQQDTIKIKKPSDWIYRANLEKLDRPLVEYIIKQGEKPTGIDDDITLQGLKNPVYLVLIGFATRKILDAARKSTKSIHRVLIIEPSMETFHALIKREYIGDIIEDEKVDLLVDVPMEDLPVQIQKIFSRTTGKLGPNPALCLNPEIFEDPFSFPPKDKETKELSNRIIKIVQDASKQVFLSMGCAADTFSRWEQTIRNEKNIQEAYKIGSLFGKFKDIPAIVVGGGPSTEQFIEAAKKYDLQNRAIIIACDASLKRLLKEGITPHLVTRCERKFTTIFSGLDREKTKDVYYVAYSWTPPEFFDLFDNKFMVFRNNGVNEWTGYQPGAVNGGVSAANAALELAWHLGCQTAYLAGIDLCFIDDKSHMSGTEVEFDIEKSKPKWTKIESNTGEMCTTIPVWYRCLQEYRAGIWKYAQNGMKCFNTSKKGAKVQGADLLEWEVVDSQLPKESFVRARIVANLDKNPDSEEGRYISKKEKAVAYLTNLKTDLFKLFLFLDDAMTTAKREELKVVHQLKAHYEPVDFFNNSESIKKNLVQVYTEPARQIDVFKSKWFPQKDFCELVLDTCQLDLFHTENRMHGLKNLVPMEHERLKTYIGIHAVLLRLIETYTIRMLDLFSKGPDVIKFDPVKEVEFFEDRPSEPEIGRQVDRLVLNALVPDEVKKLKEQFFAKGKDAKVLTLPKDFKPGRLIQP